MDESLTAQCNQNFVNYCNSFGTYGQMAPCAEQGPHAYGHNGVGSVFSDVYSSPGDPVFFMHHGFVDRMLNKWQGKNLPARIESIAGTAGPNGPPLTMDTMLASLGVRDAKSVRYIINTRGTFLCYEYDY